MAILRDFVLNGYHVLHVDGPHSTIRNKLDGIAMSRPGHPELQELFVIENLFVLVPELEEILRNAKIQSTVAEATYPKAPEDVELTMALPKSHYAQYIAMAYFPQDVQEDMGYTEMISGSHLLSVPHETAGYQGEYHYPENDSAWLAGWPTTKILGKAGLVVLKHPRALHRFASPSLHRSDWRWAVNIDFVRLRQPRVSVEHHKRLPDSRIEGHLGLLMEVVTSGWPPPVLERLDDLKEQSATVRAAYGFAARGEEDDLVECLRTQFHIEAVKTSSRQKGFFLADLVSKLPEPRLFRALTRFLVRFSWSRDPPTRVAAAGGLAAALGTNCSECRQLEDMLIQTFGPTAGVFVFWFHLFAREAYKAGSRLSDTPIASVEDNSLQMTNCLSQGKTPLPWVSSDYICSHSGFYVAGLLGDMGSAASAPALMSYIRRAADGFDESIGGYGIGPGKHHGQ
eukprot:s3668_g7.t1